MSQLKVFVSSTCYDLSQIRADLSDFIVNLGYHPILSEYSTFPVDPDDDTIENCIRNVGTADIFILILGNRYGYTGEDGKSITNTEYLYAREKGIPIFVFLYKPLIYTLPLWQKNKNADFSGQVDTVKIFELVEEIREKNKKWCFDFERAQDIIQTLKVQFSYMFKRSLDQALKFKASTLPDFYKKLSPKAINILLKEGDLFEAQFFAQVLKDELEKYEDLKLDLEYKVLTNCSQRIDDQFQLLNWLRINFTTITNQIQSLNTLFNQAYPQFYGLPGVPSDTKGLFYVASSMAKIYKNLILWSIEVESTLVNEEYIGMKNVLSSFPESAIQSLWEYRDTTLSAIEEAIKSYGQNKEHIKVESILILIIEEVKVEKFNFELERLEKLLDDVNY